jgi:hypothetical protein
MNFGTLPARLQREDPIILWKGPVVALELREAVISRYDIMI